MHALRNFLRTIPARLRYYFTRFGLFGYGRKWRKVNIGSGSVYLPGYCNIDLSAAADLYLDLEKRLLPFPSESLEAAVCISTINYFSRERGARIVKDVYRVLKQGGIARFATQDLRIIAEKYVSGDRDFFFQKLPDGRERFAGKTMGDKVNSWFYGYTTLRGKRCRYVYDFETLALLFKEAGFSGIEQKRYRESVIPDIERIDNRQEQMFFLEAIK